MAENQSTALAKIALGFLGVSGLFFYFNFAIGDTILGNLIVLFISGMSGIVAAIVSIAGIFESHGKRVYFVSLALTLSLLVSIVVLFVTGNVSAGYGP